MEKNPCVFFEETDSTNKTRQKICNPKLLKERSREKIKLYDKQLNKELVERVNKPFTLSITYLIQHSILF